MTDPLLVDLVQRLSGARVLCVGDVMLDRFTYGAVDRISPEAPIPVLRVERESAMLGAVGNVVRNLAALGAGGALAAVIGDDGAGREVAARLQALPGFSPALVSEPGRPTTIKTRFVVGGQQLLRADWETTGPISPATAAGLVEAVVAQLVGVRVMVLSDYAKGVFAAPAMLSALIDAARDAGVLVLVDPKARDFGRYQGADLLTPNRRELVEATGMPADSDAEVEAAARVLLDRHGFTAVVVTRSRDGMSVISREHPPVHLRTTAREVFDVSGAGDTVIATLAAALAVGASLADAARLANLAAGIAVGKVGTAVAHGAEIAAVLHAGEPRLARDKVVARPAAQDHVARWRSRGLKIGFTNGCFDLLHPGHVALLEAARARCDRLVVGLNADASVRRLKGPGRPVQGEAARARVLAALAATDLVVLFEEDTPLELLRALRPDLLVKGADYTLDRVVGADLVRGYGGTVHLVPLAAGHSTTALLARVADEPA